MYVMNVRSVESAHHQRVNSVIFSELVVGNSTGQLVVFEKYFLNQLSGRLILM
jgi:hypothetical protein